MNGLALNLRLVWYLRLCRHSVFLSFKLPPTMLSLPAYAKLNLGLEVLGKRADGYHDICSVLCRVSLHDLIQIETNDTIVVRCDALAHENAHENLVYKAAMSLSRAYGVVEGAKITIDKHIPIGAGLGGGSSDAAATLLGLCRFWNLPCTQPELERLATNLGADVPFFLHSGACLATGTGTVLEECTLSLPWSVLIVSPELGISTAMAYSWLGRDASKRSCTDLVAMLRDAVGNETRLRATLHNDFEQVVFNAHPELGALKTRLLDHGALYAAMSGSGSSVFGLFRSHEDAEAVTEYFSDIRTTVCHFITQTPTI